jgi:poly(A) polymerase
MRVVAGVPPVLSVRWAAVLHDIAKPVTRTHEANGRPRFFHHEEVGAAVAREVLTGLRYSNAEVDSVVLLVGTHMQLHAYSPEWSEGAVRRLVLRLGTLTDLAIALARADGAGHGLTATSSTSPKLDALEARIRALDQQQLKRPASPISGDDLMERYHRPPGPWIKRVKERVCDAILDGALDPGDVEGAWKIAEVAVADEPQAQ